MLQPFHPSLSRFNHLSWFSNPNHLKLHQTTTNISVASNNFIHLSCFNNVDSLSRHRTDHPLSLHDLDLPGWADRCPICIIYRGSCCLVRAIYNRHDQGHTSRVGSVLYRQILLSISERPVRIWMIWIAICPTNKLFQPSNHRQLQYNTEHLARNRNTPRLDIVFGRGCVAHKNVFQWNGARISCFPVNLSMIF